MYLLDVAYFALTFVEFLILFASTAALCVLVARRVVGGLSALIDAVLDACASGEAPRVRRLSPSKSNVRIIRGGHNEIF